MTASLVGSLRAMRGFAFAFFVLGLVSARPAAADGIADFNAAVAAAAAQCRVAMEVLETSGPDETAAEVQRFREAWQAIVVRFSARRPERFANNQSYTTLLLDIEVRTVGALIIINLGRQDAARNALAAIEETLSGVTGRPAAPLAR